jgi:hypothetical protein
MLRDEIEKKINFTRRSKTKKIVIKIMMTNLETIRHLSFLD